MKLNSERLSQALRVAPFAGATALAWVSVPIGSSLDWSLYLLATALLLPCAALYALALGRGRPAGVLSTLIFLAAVALLRSSAGGINSGVAVLSLIPVFYTALYSHSRWQLYFVLGGVAAFYLMPIILVGPPEYPHTQYRAALMTVAVSAIIGVATRGLVSDVRHQASEARGRELMLEQVNRVMHGLFNSVNARQDVCEAARSIGEACVAILFEPTPGLRTMRSTAIAGMEADPAEISMGQRNAVTEAFLSGESTLISENIEEHVGSLALWKLSGRPQSVLYEPLMRGGEPVGVLVVGWPAHIRAHGTRATVVSLLAHETAAVIDRADEVSELASMASTDSLTGLPNRRAWDAHIAQALVEKRRFAIAMLDLDHFKQFNDTHGHPAGDRLLKETSALWRGQLRAGDLLARLGGEEFGLLLVDCDTARALEVIERLRALIYNNRTCSVGYAEQRSGETAEQVIARADAALYEAKDRVCVSA